MPVGAYGGRRDLMQQIAPSGPIYQAGTLSGNPVAMAAGLAMLELIQAPGFHDALERAHARAVRRAGSRRARGRRAVHHQPRRRHVRPVLHRRSRSTPTPRPWPATPRRSTASSTPCSSAACTWRRRRSRPASCPARTTTAIIAGTLEAAREAFARQVAATDVRHPHRRRPRMRLETLAVHAGGEPDAGTGAVAPPIHLATTFRHGPAGERDRRLRVPARGQSRPRTACARHWPRWKAAQRRWPSPRAWRR